MRTIKQDLKSEGPRLTVMGVFLAVCFFAIQYMPATFNLFGIPIDLSLIKLGFVLSVVGFILSVMFIALKYTNALRPFEKNLDKFSKRIYDYTLYLLIITILLTVYVHISFQLGNYLAGLPAEKLQMGIFISLGVLTALLFSAFNPKVDKDE